MVALLADFQHRLLMFVLVVGTLTPIEMTITQEKHSLKGRMLGVLYWAIWTAFVMAAAQLFSLINPPSLVTWYLRTPWAGPWEYVIAPVLAALVMDGYFYFHHRVQHAVPLFWRFHAAHHSIRELNAINSYHHPFDDFIKGFISMIPLAFISVHPMNAVPALALIFALHPAYLHSPIKADLGPLRAVFGDNRFHRIHHSTDPRHFDKNFGGLSTIWDRLFGTAYWPAKDEWPEVGLAEIDQPRSVREWFSLPWRMKPRRGYSTTSIANEE